VTVNPTLALGSTPPRKLLSFPIPKLVRASPASSHNTHAQSALAVAAHASRESVAITEARRSRIMARSPGLTLGAQLVDGTKKVFKQRDEALAHPHCLYTILFQVNVVSIEVDLG
jgi:hypothetical protein